MTITSERVTVVADGVSYEPWEAVSVEWDMNNLFVSFQLSTTEVAEKTEDWTVFDKWNFPPGTQIDILGNDEALTTGIVSVYNPQVDPDQHSIVVTGFSFAKDFSDSSVKHETGRFDNTTDVAIVQQLAGALGIPLLALASPTTIPFYQIRQGGNNYQEVMRLLVQGQKMLTSNMSGQMVVTDGKPWGYNTGGMLLQGHATNVSGTEDAGNMIRMEARLSDENYYLYEAIHQSPYDDKPENLAPFGMALDPTARASRYKKIINQAVTDPGIAQKRAEWERSRAKGFTTLATCVVPGWRDQSGAFWKPNENVYVLAPWLKIDCWLRIVKLVFSQNLSGATTTTITVVDPRALGDSGGGGECNSGDMWGWF